MVVCPNCGELNDKDVLFCRSCGMQLYEKKYMDVHNAHSNVESSMDTIIKKKNAHKYNPDESFNNVKNSHIDKNGAFKVLPVNEDIKFTTDPRQNGAADNIWPNIRLTTIIALVVAYIVIMFYSGFNILVGTIVAILFFILIYLLNHYFSPLNIPDAFVVTDKAIYLMNTSGHGKIRKIYQLSSIKKIEVLLQNVIEKGLTEMENSEYDNMYHDWVDYTVKEDYTNDYDKIVSFRVVMNNNEVLNLLDMHVLSRTDIETLNKLISIFKIYISQERITVRWLPRSIVDRIKSTTPP
ncbi:MAG: zinc ribbon domain-containing protein [Thermoplasmata archaeon]